MPPSPSPLDLIDRSQHLAFGGRSSIAASSSINATAPVGGSPRSFGQRIAAGSATSSSSPAPASPPRLRAPLRSGQHGSSSPGGLSPAAKFALSDLSGEREAANVSSASSIAIVAAAALPCSICLSHSSDAMILPCGHSSFCFACLTRWSSNHSNCPVCRHAIMEITQMTPADVRRRDAAESSSK